MSFEFVKKLPTRQKSGNNTLFLPLSLKSRKNGMLKSGMSLPERAINFWLLSDPAPRTTKIPYAIMSTGLPE